MSFMQVIKGHLKTVVTQDTNTICLVKKSAHLNGRCHVTQKKEFVSAFIWLNVDTPNLLILKVWANKK